MLLGIDVGGTFTDAVLINEGKIAAQAKTPTTHGDLLRGIFFAIDSVLQEMPGAVERVSLSTTVVTNCLVQGQTDPVGLVLVPGPGLNIEPLLPDKAVVLPGYVDHRGREVAAPDKSQMDGLLASFGDREVFAVSGKFAVRNPALERRIAAALGKRALHVTIASAISGSLNFLRRTNSAYFNAAVWRKFNQFAVAVEQALAARNITAPVHILKADGGTLPLFAAKEQPVETIFTGPAASVLGIMAMCRPQGDTISLDIGGTTTDIALWRNGIPLFASQGALVGKYCTAVRGFWLHSVGIGGDSVVRRYNGKIVVGPERLGPAMASGGTLPTVADALIVANRIDFGNRFQAYEAMRQIGLPDQSPEETAQETLLAAVTAIIAAINQMLALHQSQPVYTVDDIIHSKPFQPEAIIGVGGTAAGLAPLVAAKMKIECTVPEQAAIANAVGAAVAAATTDVTLRIDTEQGILTVAELGLQENVSQRRVTLEEARQLTRHYLALRSEQTGIPLTEAETVYEEEFHLVRGFQTTGRIITCRQQVKPGVISHVV